MKIFPLDEIEGVPADRQDLEVFRGSTSMAGFAPGNPGRAINYYLKKLREIMENQYRLTQPQQLEFIRYYNRKIFSLRVTAGQFSGNTTGSNVLTQKFFDFFSARLLSILRVESYSVFAGLSIRTSRTFQDEFMGYSFSMRIIRVEYRDSELVRVSFHYEDGNSGRNYLGLIEIDHDRNQVNVHLQPTVGQDNLDNFNPAYVPELSEKVKALMGLVYLVRVPEFESKAFQHGQAAPSNPQAINRSVTNVGPERKSEMFPFRRRTIHSLAAAWEKAQELVASLTPAMRQFLEENFGAIGLNVFFLTFSKEREDRWSVTFNRHIHSAGRIGDCLFDRADVETLVGQALELGQQAVISIYGGWFPPELDNKPAGPAKSPHVRRLRRIGRVMLVGGSEVVAAAEMRSLFERRQRGDQLSAEDHLRLDEFLVEHGITDPSQVSFTHVENPGVHFADGSHRTGNTHRGGGQGGRYVIGLPRQKSAGGRR